MRPYAPRGVIRGLRVLGGHDGGVDGWLEGGVDSEMRPSTGYVQAGLQIHGYDAEGMEGGPVTADRIDANKVSGPLSTVHLCGLHRYVVVHCSVVGNGVCLDKIRAQRIYSCPVH